MEAVGAFLLAVALLALVIGLPMLCGVLLRRMGGSQGLREFLGAYGPPSSLIPGRSEPDDKTDAPTEQAD